MEKNTVALLRENLDKGRIRRLSPLGLAWLGDAVYSVYVRKFLLTRKPRKTDALHRLSVGLVSAPAQAKTVRRLIEDTLSAEEISLVKKGKNAVKNHPNSASLEDYGYATGFEALLGHLYLEGKTERIEEIIARSVDVNYKNSAACEKPSG